MLSKTIQILILIFIILFLIWWMPRCSQPPTTPSSDESSSITEGLSGAAGSALDAAKGTGSAVVDGAGKIVGSIGDTASGIVDGAGNIASNSVDRVKDAGSAVADGASNIAGAIGDAASGSAARVEAAATGALDKAKDAGSAIADSASTLSGSDAAESGQAVADNITGQVAGTEDIATQDSAERLGDAPNAMEDKADAATHSAIPSGVTASSAGEGAANAAEAIRQTLSAQSKAKNMVLEGVAFTTNSDQLSGDSSIILDSVAESLSANTNVEVVIAGYTDNTGDPDYNRALSQKRAKAVREYLISQGISETRMTAKGYGIESPIADNATSDGRRKNRRVELHVK